MRSTGVWYLLELPFGVWAETKATCCVLEVILSLGHQSSLLHGPGHCAAPGSHAGMWNVPETAPELFNTHLGQGWGMRPSVCNTLCQMESMVTVHHPYLILPVC